MHLTGKTVLITGGSSGIGLHLALLLINKGNIVIITGRSEERLAAAKSQESRLITIRSDVANYEDLKSLHSRILKEYPSLSVLINNAGIMSEINLHHGNDTNLDTIEQEIVINLLAPIQLTVLLLPLLKSQKEAAIVNITSGLAFIPFPITPIYGATKAGLHSFTECLRVQLGQTKNVKVIEVAPPQAKTNLTQSFEDSYEQGPQMSPQDVAMATFKGIEGEKELVLPGLAKILRFMGRFAPGFMLHQLSKKTVPILLAKEESKASKED